MSPAEQSDLDDIVCKAAEELGRPAAERVNALSEDRQHFFWTLVHQGSTFLGALEVCER